MNLLITCWNWLRGNWGWLKWPATLAVLSCLFYQNREGISHLAKRPIHWPSYLAAFAAATANVLLSFVRWWVLVRAQEFPFRLRDALRIGFISYAFNLVGVGAMGGDAVKAMFMVQEQTSRRTTAVATILLDRILGLVTLFMVGAAAVLFQTRLIERTNELKGIAAILWAGSAVGLAGFSLLAWPATSRWSLWRRLGRLPLVGRLMDEIQDAIGIYQRKRRQLAVAAAISLAAHVCGFSAFYFCAQALQAGSAAPTWCAHLLLIPAAVVAEAVIPLPGGVGALEAAVQYCYVLANAASPSPVSASMARETGFLTTLAFRGLTLVLTVLGIGFYLASRKALPEKQPAR